jgi:hypothetical protein
MIETITQKLSILTIILSVIGVIGNIISLLICLKEELRKIPTFVFIIFQKILNIIKLVIISLSIFVTQFQSNFKNFQDINNIYYNIAIFLFFWEYQSSAYLSVFSKTFKINLNCFLNETNFRSL